MIDAATGIFFVSLVYVLITVFLNKKYGGRDRIKQIQKEINDYQKELKKATESSDEQAVKRLQAREKEVTGMMSEMMTLPLKSMVIILPIFFVFIGTEGFLGLHFPGIVNYAFPGFITQLPFDLHVNAVFSTNVLSNVPQASTYGARGFFIVAALFWGLVSEALLSQLEKRGVKLPLA